MAALSPGQSPPPVSTPMRTEGNLLPVGTNGIGCRPSQVGNELGGKVANQVGSTGLSPRCVRRGLQCLRQRRQWRRRRRRRRKGLGQHLDYLLQPPPTRNV